ncbi:MAG: HAMP domain-containing protein [Thermoflexales bacterium]|nr:HAMP domain-containing protein [Thermoflexales bacterium]
MVQQQPTLSVGRAFNPAHWKIRNKVVSVVLFVVIVLVFFLTLFNYLTLSNNITQMRGQELANYGREALQRSANVVDGSVKALETLALSPSIIEAVEAAREAHAGRDRAELEAEIAALDRAWQDRDPSAAALVAQIADNEISAHLKAFLRAFPEEVEVFVTDVEGLNVGMSGRTSDYVQSDEAWWQGAYNSGRGKNFISEVDYDDSAQVWAIDIGVPIRDKKGQAVIGVLRGTVDISLVFRALPELSFGKTGHAALLDRNGRILYAQNPNLLMQPAPQEILTAIRGGKGAWRSDLHDLDGNPAIVAYQVLDGELAESLGWTILLDQDRSEVNADILETLPSGLLVAAVVATVMALVGLGAARSIALPLVAATHQARRLALGDAAKDDTRLGSDVMQRGDETGDLLRAFQDLRAYVREMASNAQQIAAGKLSVDVRSRGEKDILGQAFGQMIAYLQDMAAAAGRLAGGDVSAAVTPQSDQDVLGLAFARMIDYQKAMAAAAGQLAEGDVSTTVSPHSDQDVLGLAFARMIDYQQTMAAAAGHLAGGDLTAEVRPQSGRDALGTAFAQMIANLRELIHQVAENAHTVSVASEQMAEASDQAGLATSQVATTIQQVAEGTSQQAEIITRTAASVEQLAQSINSVARGAQEQADAVAKSADLTTQIASAFGQMGANAQSMALGSAQAAETARRGAHTVEETVKNIQAIHTKVGFSAQKVREMGQRSKQIGAIVETIDNIASQTNLLALNAAIEAARAGEQGRGFAVVADAVRELSEKSAQATREISELIEEVQSTIAEAVQAMDEGTREVEVGVVRAGEAGQALKDILLATEDANRQMNEIAAAAGEMGTLSGELVGAMDAVSAVVEENTAATEEMAASSDQVTQAIENIAGISEENSASAEEVAASVEEANAQTEEVTASAQNLSDMAQALQALVTRFTLPGTSRIS